MGIAKMAAVAATMAKAGMVPLANSETSLNRMSVSSIFPALQRAVSKDSLLNASSPMGESRKLPLKKRRNIGIPENAHSSKRFPADSIVAEDNGKPTVAR